MSAGILNIENRKAKVRDSNIELYRIISMLLIVAHHYVVNSGLLSLSGPVYSDILSIKSLFLLLFGAWGKIGINCFVLITGYFMCKSHISAKKFVKLLFELMFYKIAINSIFWISGYASFDIKSFVKVLLPFTTVENNFTGTFLIFFLFIPFLNILIQNLTEKQHIKLIFLSLFTYVFFGTLPFCSVKMNYVSWFVVLYFISSYISLYPKEIFKNKRFWGILSIVTFMVCSLSVIFGSWAYSRFGLGLSYFFVSDSNTFLALLMGISSFLYFKNIDIKPSKFINTVSSTTFGVLLIHANGDVMRRWLWGDILNNVGMYNSGFIYIHAVFSVIAIFAVCCVIDLLRIRFIEKPFFKLWDKKWIFISEKYNSIENKFLEKFHVNS